MPRALFLKGRLMHFITDAWVRPGSELKRLPGRLAGRLCERFHPELASANVSNFTRQLVLSELIWRAQRRKGWNLFIERNRWFQRKAVDELTKVVEHPGERTVILAHSYAALNIFKHAKSRGWATVLAQIDPGEEHYRTVRRVSEERPEYGEPPAPPPAGYFEAWREECSLADRIIVNSPWAREALERAGVPSLKLRVVPLTYEPEVNATGFQRRYPTAFEPSRPLKALFVGHASVVKGVPALLEAMDLLRDVPLEVRMVGEASLTLRQRFQSHQSVRWLGQVSRSVVMDHCRECDVLVFPSLSDGFGMAQVEAQGWQLPVIASRFCGQVVRDGINGILLPEVTPAAIAAALRRVAARPELLSQFSINAGRSGQSGLSGLASDLLGLEPA